MNEQTFSEALRANCKARCLKQYELAELMGISAAYLSDLMQAKRMPTPKLATKAAYIFGQPDHEWHNLGAIQCGWKI